MNSKVSLTSLERDLLVDKRMESYTDKQLYAKKREASRLNRVHSGKFRQIKVLKKQEKVLEKQRDKIWEEMRKIANKREDVSFGSYDYSKFCASTNSGWKYKNELRKKLDMMIITAKLKGGDELTKAINKFVSGK